MLPKSHAGKNDKCIYIQMIHVTPFFKFTTVTRISITRDFQETKAYLIPTKIYRPSVNIS